MTEPPDTYGFSGRKYGGLCAEELKSIRKKSTLRQSLGLTDIIVSENPKNALAVTSDYNALPELLDHIAELEEANDRLSHAPTRSTHVI